MKTKYYVPASVALITFIVYLPALRNEFVLWDDSIYVFDNYHIRSLNAAFFRWAFFDFYAANWHPLTWISHALDYAVWGLNPMGHHLTNIILHAINTFLVALLVVKLLEVGNTFSLYNSPCPPLKLRGGAEGGGVISTGGFSDKETLIAAATTGLLFGLHPIHVESVAWVAERKDLLCALFFLLSIMMYIRYSCNTFLPCPLVGNPPETVLNAREDLGQAGMTRPGLRFLDKHYLLSLAFFTLALLSKPMAVSLPVVLLILDWYPFGRIRSLKTFRPAFVGKLPFITLSIISSGLTILAQKSSLTPLVYSPLSSRALVASKSLIIYFWKMIIPLHLIPFYPYPKTISLSLDYLGAIALFIGITIACIITAKNHKLWLSVWCCYVITLVPVIGIVQVGSQSMADRYTYLPSLGPFLAAGVVFALVFRKINTLRIGRVIVSFAYAIVVVFALFSITYLTIRQLHIWKNSIDLWSYVIEKEHVSAPVAYNNRGLAFKEADQLDKAMADFKQAIALDPFLGQAYSNLGMIYGNLGMCDKSIEYLDRSISINPTDPISFFNRGLCHFYISQYDKSLEDFSKAILLNQNYAKAYLYRGHLYYKIGEKALAVSDYRKACDLGNADGCNAL